ncbi:SDR family NAD(P)-dependent oxidoreductase [Singulisphaera sp. PoT]|uniref:SDR family NAD(P)-dependent oxidoreductase n=1 Tax=Singulisphaera sp. PoT TaxID=3411797 RepID=UPI003BF531C9
MTFQSKNAPVLMLTGAAHGIGRATTHALADHGFRLGLVDRAREPLEQVAEQLRAKGCSVVSAVADVKDSESLHRAVAAIESGLGPVETLVACAGVGGLSSATNLDIPAFRDMLEINVLGVARSIEAVLPGMFARGSGHIVGISSVAGYRGLPWMPGYSASKAALTTYLEGLRPSLKRRGVSITTVYPGFVRTAITQDTPFRKPVKMLEPDQAAKSLVRAIVRKPRDFVFPFSAAVGMGFLKKVPNRMFDWMMDRAGPQALTTEF